MARVPQLYAIPRAQQSQHSQVDDPFSDRSVPSPSDRDLHAPPVHDERNSTNLSSIGGLLLGGGNNKPAFRDEEEYVGVDKNSLHARVMRDMVDSAYEPAYDEPTPNYEMYDDNKARASRSLNKAPAGGYEQPGTPTRANLPKLQMPTPSTPTRQYAQLGPHGPPTPSTPTHPNGNGAPMGHPMFNPTPMHQPQPQMLGIEGNETYQALDRNVRDMAQKVMSDPNVQQITDQIRQGALRFGDWMASLESR
ncbi:ADP-ribosylation factor GTPase activator [Trichosporon asahii var. asahii CBS 8904]|uniref:ADP-ribosylation factor GTPase activator n=1 Tax=Trichosporon asahii var. asahii (strain CBS 8904) TaxID=1220162 RepID=K1W786_TRIAC|nr:ADP-ribosylation factor GTPase activator [Trichosporon asahii var. asahii CBS 8904]